MTNLCPASSPLDTSSNSKPIENKVIDSEISNESMGKDCAICLNKISDLAVLPCGHEFDRMCVNEALQHNMRCPLCAQDLYQAVNLSCDSFSKIKIESTLEPKIKENTLIYFPITMCVNQHGKNKIIPLI